MSIIDRYFKRKGINDYSELTEAEKKTYSEWEATLSGRKLTDDDVSAFIGQEIEEIEARITDPNLPLREDVFLKMKLEFCRKIRTFLLRPEMEKKAMEDHINSL